MSPRVNRILKVVVLVEVLLVVVLIFATHKAVKAQEVKEVKPYAFAELPNGTHVYKLVHEGCELYVAQNYVGQINHADSVGIAITTGRGCGK